MIFVCLKNICANCKKKQVIEDIREVVRRPPGRFEAIPDNLTAQEIAEQTAAAAKGNTAATISI